MSVDLTPTEVILPEPNGKLVRNGDQWEQHVDGRINYAINEYTNALINACIDAGYENALLEVGKTIHYPQCWDTVNYPTLESAVCEIFNECQHCGKVNHVG